MSKSGAALKAVPAIETAGPGILRMELDGEEKGQWIEYQEVASASMVIAMLRADTDFASALEAVGKRITRHSFGGNILDQPLPVIIRIIQRWNVASEAQAVNPPTASD